MLTQYSQDEQDDEGAVRPKSEGFWKEFFLLPPNRAALRTLLREMRPADVVLLDIQTRELFARGVATVKRGKGAAVAHALDVRSLMPPGVEQALKEPDPDSQRVPLVYSVQEVFAPELRCNCRARWHRSH